MMEYDTQKAARVWQRVQNEKKEANVQPQGEHLPALIMEQLQLSSAYLQLSRQTPGKEGTEFARLARGAKAQAVCLKGILVLTSGHVSPISSTPLQATGTDTLLRRCYGKELRLLKAYENRRSDEEYGPVFDRMAQRGREHCCALLELIGKTGNTK